MVDVKKDCKCIITAICLVYYLLHVIYLFNQLTRTPVRFRYTSKEMGNVILKLI